MQCHLLLFLYRFPKTVPSLVLLCVLGTKPLGVFFAMFAEHGTHTTML